MEIKLCSHQVYFYASSVEFWQNEGPNWRNLWPNCHLQRFLLEGLKKPAADRRSASGAKSSLERLKSVPERWADNTADFLLLLRTHTHIHTHTRTSMQTFKETRLQASWCLLWSIRVQHIAENSCGRQEERCFLKITSACSHRKRRSRDDITVT